MIPRHIPRAAWDDVKAMYLDKAMTKQAIADHYGSTIGRVKSALRYMDCKLSPAEVIARNKARLAPINALRAPKPMIVKPAPPYSIFDLIRAAHFITAASIHDICGPRRWRYITRIRQAICHLAHEHYSFNHVGRVISRDHSTVMHGCRVAADLVARDVNFRRLVESIRNEALRAKARERQNIMASVESIAA